MNYKIDQGLLNDIKTILLASKQEVANTQQMITLINKLQNLEKIEE